MATNAISSPHAEGVPLPPVTTVSAIEGLQAFQSIDTGTPSILKNE